jgi:hypothetical protein
VSYMASVILDVKGVTEDMCMKQIADKNRKVIEAKFANVFNSEINYLPTELREILLDDMVTAFENRLNVLNNAMENQPSNH